MSPDELESGELQRAGEGWFALKADGVTS